MESLYDTIQTLLRKEQQWWNKKSDVYGVPTGIHSLDKVTGGLQQGHSVVLAAGTGHGKSSLGGQIFFNAATDIKAASDAAGEPVGQVLLFTPEMSSDSVLLRQVSQWSRLDYLDIKAGRESDEERALWLSAVEESAVLARYLKTQSGSLDVLDVIDSVQQEGYKGPPISLVVVDYLQRLVPSGNFDEISEASTRLKSLANDLDIPVLVLCQVNRERAKRGDKLRLQDLRGSGRIEEDADMVWLLDNPEPESGNGSDIRRASLEIAKNRHGPTSTIDLLFHPSLTLFTEVDETVDW